jgi:hypothetical protein
MAVAPEPVVSPWVTLCRDPEIIESPVVTLFRLLEEAGAKVCLCFTCSHKPEYGPCAACGCKNLPYDQRLNQQKEGQDV